RRYHTLRDHAADNRGINACLQRRYVAHRARVLVATRHVPEQIASRDDPELAQRLRTRRTDALEKVDRRVEPQPRGHRCSSAAPRHQSPSTSREKRAASNATRWVAFSPTPTNFTGTSIASCTATTTPVKFVGVGEKA